MISIGIFNVLEMVQWVALQLSEFRIFVCVDKLLGCFYSLKL